jgi:hypothetical protein
MQTETYDKEAFGETAKAIYQKKYKTEFEEKYKGQYVAIDVESGDAFVGETGLEAYYEAIKTHPGNFFFFIRIGLPPLKRRGVRRKKETLN